MAEKMNPVSAGCRMKKRTVKHNNVHKSIKVYKQVKELIEIISINSFFDPIGGRHLDKNHPIQLDNSMQK